MRAAAAPSDVILGEVPEDACRRLRIYADLLQRWQPTVNLVAPATLAHLWTRHIADSLQVHAAVPKACRWIDLGSGGGFPGLVTAIVLAERAEARVHLVESDKRKAAFLRTVARETGAPAIIHADRIEAVVPRFDERINAVSARALAALPKLIDFAYPFLRRGAVGVFPKGETAEAELTGLAGDRRFRIDSIPSRIRDGSSLLVVRLERNVTEAAAHGAGGD